MKTPQNIMTEEKFLPKLKKCCWFIIIFRKITEVTEKNCFTKINEK